MRLNKLLLLSICALGLCIGGISQSQGAGILTELATSSMMRRLPFVAVQSQPFKHSSIWVPIRYASTSKKSNAVSIGHPCIDAVFQYGFGRPHVAETFINTVLRFEGANKITEVTFLPRDLPSNNPTDPIAYNFTVDVRCKTQDGRYFLVEMQNDFRDDYHLKALIEHSRMIGRIDLDQHEAANNTDSGSPKVSSTKYWRDISGIYSIVLTNKAFGETKMKKTYSDEPVMEPDLLNTYELRNVHHLNRHFGDIPNQLTLLMLANLEDKPISARSHLERWASLFQEKALRYGARKIPETKAIEDPEELAAGDAAMKEFIDSLDIRHLPQAVREQYIRNLRYYNDSWADIEEKATARGEARGIEKGKAEGKAEGENAKAIEIALGMLKDKLPISTIVKYTGLTADEIKAIK